jgi:hypothetical protein
LHSNDLALRINNKEWLVFVAGDADAFEKMRRRAGRLLQEANRNRVGPPLPHFVTTLVGRWPSTEQVDTILREIAAALPRKELDHVQPVLQS